MTTIDDLPVDVWLFIFRNLSIKDLFNCRLVNRKFKNFSDHSDGIYKLAIGKLCSFEPHFENKELMKDEDVISMKTFKRIKSLSLFNLNRYLKYLKINMIYLTGELNVELSNLINLEFIEIHNPKNTICIEFNKLKYLIINHCNTGFQCNFNLNTPNLEKIKFNSTNNHFKFSSNPVSVKHLISNQYSEQFKFFINLEIIELNLIPNNLMESNDDAKYNLDSNLLSIFNKLRQLKIHLKSSCFDAFPSRLKNHLINFLNEKCDLERNFDIYLYGVKIIDIDALEEITNYQMNELKYQIKNYDLLDTHLPFVNRLNYTRLENCFSDLQNNLPSNFFDKYFNLYHIDVRDNNYEVLDLIFKNSNYFSLNPAVKHLNANNLNWFLGNLKNLTILQLIGVSFNQHFYDNLPTTIRKLEIKSYDKKFNINFNFIFKLSKLQIFSLMGNNDRNYIFNLAIESLQNLEQLNHFHFRYIDAKKFETKIKYRKLLRIPFNRSRENRPNRFIKLYHHSDRFFLNIQRIEFSKNNNLFSLNLRYNGFAKVKIVLNYEELKQYKKKILSSRDLCINRKPNESKLTKLWNSFKNIFQFKPFNSNDESENNLDIDI